MLTWWTRSRADLPRQRFGQPSRHRQPADPQARQFRQAVGFAQMDVEVEPGGKGQKVQAGQPQAGLQVGVVGLQPHARGRRGQPAPAAVVEKQFQVALGDDDGARHAGTVAPGVVAAQYLQRAFDVGGRHLGGLADQRGCLHGQRQRQQCGRHHGGQWQRDGQGQQSRQRSHERSLPPRATGRRSAALGHARLGAGHRAMPWVRRAFETPAAKPAYLRTRQVAVTTGVTRWPAVFTR
jgi:hypothetical protein